MGAYETCISKLRKAQSGRRITSLKRISPVNFSKEVAQQISANIISLYDSFTISIVYEYMCLLDLLTLFRRVLLPLSRIHISHSLFTACGACISKFKLFRLRFQNFGVQSEMLVLCTIASHFTKVTLWDFKTA